MTTSHRAESSSLCAETKVARSLRELNVSRAPRRSRDKERFCIDSTQLSRQQRVRSFRSSFVRKGTNGRGDTSEGTAPESFEFRTRGIALDLPESLALFANFWNLLRQSGEKEGWSKFGDPGEESKSPLWSKFISFWKMGGRGGRFIKTRDWIEGYSASLLRTALSIVNGEVSRRWNNVSAGTTRD